MALGQVREKGTNINYILNINIKKNYLAMYGFHATRMSRKFELEFGFITI